MIGRHRRWIVPALAAAFILAASTVVAWAFWRAPGTGTASASSGTMAAATISAPASAIESVTVTWTQQASLQPVSAGNSAITYSVERKLGAGPWVAVAGGGCAGPKAYGVTTCTDSPPAAGSYSYRAVANYHMWTATSGGTGSVSFTVDTTAPTTSAQLIPPANAAGWNNTSPVTVTLSADDGAGSGVASIKYTTDGTDPTTSGTVAVYTTPLSRAATTTVNFFATDLVGHKSIVQTVLVSIDTTAPAAPTLAFSALTNTYWSGSTLYYRSTAASGAFTVTANATDVTSGIASFTFPTLPSGWTPTAGMLGVNTYSWSAANPTAPSGAQNVTATNNAALTSPASGFTTASDITAPAGGSVAYTDGYYGALSVSASFATGTDTGGSGVGGASGLLQRQEATMTAGVCGGYGAGFSTMTGGTNPSSPLVDTSVVSGKCYQYRYLISDNVGNQATYTSASVAKVDSTPPAITRAVAAKTDGSTPGTIRQGGDYYVYAQVTDNGAVSAVTANASSFDTGITATSLSTTSGPWTVGGQSYSHRSVLLTANTPLTTGTTPSYTVTATDAAGNTAGPTPFTATIETYSSAISGTAGLASYWRLNDGAIAADEFTGTTGTELSLHTGALGASWTSVPSQAQTAVINSGGEVRKATGNGAAQYYTSATPANANYLVEGIVHAASFLTTDAAGVVGRQDISGTGQTYYMAAYVVSLSRWELSKVVNGTSTLIGTGIIPGTYLQFLTAGANYRVTLQMNGTTITLLVDGVARITATDSSITTAGRGGLRLGTSTSTAQVADGTGLHLDNFHITSLTATAADSKGSSPGTFFASPQLNTPGALVGDINRAVTFDLSTNYVTVPDAAALRPAHITLEAWVNPNAGIPDFSSIATKTTVSSWDDGYGMYYWGGNAYFWINDDSTNYARATTVPTGAWTHLVGTYDGAVINMYKNGVLNHSIPYTGAIVHSTGPLYIASATGPYYFPGSIDEVGIYSRALSATEVLDHYKAGAGTG
jgi:hypothetical protein